MSGEDERCCGTGHCMINADGQCWCGQQWMAKKCANLSPKLRQKVNQNAKAMLPSHPLILRRAISPLNAFWPKRCMLGGATGHAFSPHSERAGFHIGAHKIDHR